MFGDQKQQHHLLLLDAKQQMLECEKQDLLIRRERINLIYAEAKAEELLSRSRGGGLQQQQQQKRLCIMPTPSSSSSPERGGTKSNSQAVVLCPASDEGEEEDEIVPATDDEEEHSKSKDPKTSTASPAATPPQGNKAATAAAMPPEQSDVPSQQEYDCLLLLSTTSKLTEDDRQRLALAKQVAWAMEENAGDDEALQGIRYSFLARCSVPSKLTHLDSLFMPGFKHQLEAIRVPTYEAHLQERLNRCMDKMKKPPPAAAATAATPEADAASAETQTVVVARKAWVLPNAKQEAARIGMRISHYCSLVHLNLMRKCYLRRDVEESLMFECSGGGGGIESAAAPAAAAAAGVKMDWNDVDVVAFRLQNTDSLTLSGIVPRYVLHA